MKINIKKFKNVVIKGTMNFGIETLQLRFENERIMSNMLSSTGTSISILNLPNNIIDTNEDLVFNFSETSNELIPYLNLIDEESIDFTLSNLFMNLIHGQNTTKICFCSENSVRRLGGYDVQDVGWFYEMPIDAPFLKEFDKIKKIGSKFGKVYFVVDKNELFIETSDRTNMYSNGHRMKLTDIDKPDIQLSYKYADVVNFFHCIEMDVDKHFNLKIAYNDEQELGCIYAHSLNNEEKYALISKADI